MVVVGGWMVLVVDGGWCVTHLFMGMVVVKYLGVMVLDGVAC